MVSEIAGRKDNSEKHGNVPNRRSPCHSLMLIMCHQCGVQPYRTKFKPKNSQALTTAWWEALNIDVRVRRGGQLLYTATTWAGHLSAGF